MSWFLITQRLILDFVLHIVYFPLWWYTKGTKKILLGCFDMIGTANRQFSPGLWAKNLFVPMFGQRDWQGRFTSFIVRFFNVIFRSIFLALWGVIVMCFFVLWIVFPLVVVYMLTISFVAVVSSKSLTSFFSP